LAEWALQRWSDFPDHLTIADFACGSAVFLTEALRVLERRDFRGTVNLIGRDKSAQAVTMAKVAVKAVQREINTMQIVSDVCEADAIDSEWPEADVILMNPPFRSWERMTKRERDWVLDLTKGLGRGRPDLSVAFLERATRCLKTSGALATLVPAGVLASERLAKWRDRLLERTAPTLIAVLGEHGLFQHAVVNVGILAVEERKNASEPTMLSKPLRVAWSSAETGAASRVIRAIRRSITLPGEIASGPGELNGWSLTVTSLKAWKQRPSWLPGAGILGNLLDDLQIRIATKVGDLFQIHQGIRTGANEVFVQPAKVVLSLPKSEQKYFKEAVDAESFMEGEVRPRNFLFVPDLDWQTESAVERVVPEFFTKYLRPNEKSLRNRKSLRASHWWGLSEKRSWAFEGTPRLVSKRFGLYPAFARDSEGRFAVVQANAWKATAALSTGRDDETLRELLTPYWWLLNSRVMVALLREFCPNVAGGQLDLEHKYVRHVPLPNLVLQFQENPTLQALAASIRTRSEDRLPKIRDRDEFAAAAFGTNLGEWNLSGLESPD
jgi:hypothetical protein